MPQEKLLPAKTQDQIEQNSGELPLGKTKIKGPNGEELIVNEPNMPEVKGTDRTAGFITQSLQIV